MSTCENVWLWRFYFTPKPFYIISFFIFFCGGNVANHGEKDHYHRVLPNLTLAIVVFVSFNLWISHGKVDTFALVINFLNDN
jgi:hypothetical protein